MTDTVQAAPVSQIKTATSLDLAWLIALGAIWGSSFIAIKIAVVDLHAIAIAFLRIGLAAVVLAAWMMATRQSLRIAGKDWPLMALMAVLGNVVPFLCMGLAAPHIPASMMGLLMATNPFFAVIAGHLFTKDDRMNRALFIAVVFGFCGVLLLFGREALSDPGQSTFAKLAVIFGSLCYLSNGFLVRRAMHISTSALSTIQLAIGAVVLLPFLFLFSAVPADVGRDAWLAILYLGIIPTGIAALIRFWLLKRTGLGYLAQVGFLIPVFGVFWAWLLLDETPTVRILASLAFILAGIWLTQRARRAK